MNYQKYDIGLFNHSLYISMYIITTSLHNYKCIQLVFFYQKTKFPFFVYHQTTKNKKRSIKIKYKKLEYGVCINT